MAYEPREKTLDVEFASGRIYRYYGVPREVYDWLLRVPSKGRFFNRKIRDHYRFEEISRFPPSNRDLTEVLQQSLDQLRSPGRIHDK